MILQLFARLFPVASRNGGVYREKKESAPQAQESEIGILLGHKPKTLTCPTH